MALDIAILDSTGKINRSIPVGWVTHEEVIQLADIIGDCPLVLRMNDYYQDVEYEPTDLEAFLTEIEKLGVEAKSDTEVRALLKNLQELLKEAQHDQTRVHAIAD